MSANLSVPSLPKPVTGISQGSAFASGPASDAPTNLMDAFANLLNTGAQHAGGSESNQTQAPGLTLSNAFNTSTALSTAAGTNMSIALPGAPTIELGVETGTGGQNGGAPGNLISQIAQLLAGKRPEADATDTGTETGTETGLTMADPLTAIPETETETDGADIDPAALLSGLLDALNLLQDRLAQGKPADPALVKSIEDTLGALADLMGMPVGALEDLLAPQLNAAALPPTLAGQLSVEEIARLNAGAEGRGATPAIPAVPASDDGPAQPATPAVPPAHALANRPPNDLEALTAKLAELAKSLAASEPGLASKLQALSQNLAAAQPELITRLGFNAHLRLADADADAALDSLIATRTPDRPATPAPAIAAPTLDLPETLKGVERPTLDAKAEPATTEPAKPEKALPETGKPEVAPRSAEAVKPDAVRPRGEPAPQANAAAPAPDAKPDQPTTNNAAGLPPVRADGIPAGARAVQAAYQTPHTQVNIPQMAYEIVRHVSDGHNRFQIRLDPAELGRIDVRMDIDNKGTVNARLTVERAETLDLLQRDQRALEKALAQAGLDSSKTNLEFSLKQNPFGRQDNGHGQGRDGNPSFAGGEAKSAAEEPATIIPATLYRGAATASGVNLFV